MMVSDESAPAVACSVSIGLLYTAMVEGHELCGFIP